MRSRQARLIITFATTAMALKMEKLCRACGAPGRLIPVPKEITAGCGLAWMAQPEEQAVLEQTMQDGQVAPQEIHVLGGKES